MLPFDPQDRRQFIKQTAATTILASLGPTDAIGKLHKSDDAPECCDRTYATVAASSINARPL